MTVRASEIEAIKQRNERASYNYWNNYIDTYLTTLAQDQKYIIFEGYVGSKRDGFVLTENVAYMLGTSYGAHGWKVQIAPDPDPRDHLRIITIESRNQ